MVVEPELTIADSIAIKILPGGAVLRGVGNELHLHTHKGSKSRVLLQKLQAKVHGIDGVQISDYGQGRLIAHGEKECLVLQYVLASEEYTFKELYHFRVTDWISSAKFLCDPNEFVLLTSHGVVLRMFYDEKAVEQNVCNIRLKSSSNDKSTLYCSHIHGNVFEELIIFGGNAFGELLIWKPSAKAFTRTTSSVNNNCTEIRVLLMQRISAHNGVIFSIDFNAEFNILTTTSDDRSIRLWKRKLSSASDLTNFKFIPIASGYGHVARVFQGKIMHFDGQPFAITAGEDSYICLWKANADLVFKKRLHFSATIWNFEYEPNTYTLYTVGSTGNLLAYSLKDILNNKSVISSTIALTESLDTNEYVAKAKFLNPNIIIGMTNKNNLLYTLHSTDSSTGDEYGPWQLITMDLDKTFKCTVLEVYDNSIAMCGYKNLTLLKYNGEGVFKKSFECELLNGVIRAFHFLSNNRYLVSDDTGKSLFLQGECLQIRIAVPLPYCKEPWTTSALQVQAQNKKDYLIISNRQGNILLFHLEVATASCIYLSTIRQPHGALGATILRLQEICNKHVFIQSAGHDGSIRSYVITTESDAGTIKPYQRTLVPISWVEQIIIIENIEYLLGFNDNHFVVWSRQHDFSVQVPCGGGHRSWHYNIISDKSGKTNLHLLFIKNKKIRLHQTVLYNVPETCINLYRNEWHTRSCNVLKTIDQLDHNIIISAGDDNMVKIFKLLLSNRQLVCCAELHAHISNIRALQLLQIHSDEYLIFSGGGRAQLCISRLNLNSFRLQELLSYTLNKVEQKQGNGENSYQLEPETRIMACDVVKSRESKSNINGGGYLVFLGCSDGYLRKVYLSQTFKVVSEEAKYYGCCLLQVQIFANLYVITAGTDGKIRFFDLNLIELPIQLSHHASGVNTMDIIFQSDESILHILTGGDDQSISYSALQLRGASLLQIQKEFHLPNAHSAQVSAVQFFYDNEDSLCAYTSGLDQIVNIVDINSQKIRYVCQTCVADTKGLTVDSFKRCIVYGCGMQIFKLKR